jgi:hypothetical protein
MAAADGAELVPAEPAEQGRDARAEVVGEPRDEAVLSVGRFTDLAAEEAAEVEEAARGDYGEDGRGGQRRERWREHGWLPGRGALGCPCVFLAAMGLRSGCGQGLERRE